MCFALAKVQIMPRCFNPGGDDVLTGTLYGVACQSADVVLSVLPVVHALAIR